eukprot:TRINITY_DN21312_c0_g1_i1.p1 TRINITY_DN21312_c0_g1~~TRINITY_DN21312_c0_g1_i1.p1  ORF type:complete len:117 (+),score=53.15 TRINITY_DN21312_c0_g1_i1:3-353(+)
MRDFVRQQRERHEAIRRKTEEKEEKLQMIIELLQKKLKENVVKHKSVSELEGRVEQLEKLLAHKTAALDTLTIKLRAIESDRDSLRRQLDMLQTSPASPSLLQPEGPGPSSPTLSL